MSETTFDERYMELLDKMQAARVQALIAHERYAGARAVLDQAGRDPRWHRTPQTVVSAMVDAVDSFAGAHGAALDAETSAMGDFLEAHEAGEAEDLPVPYCTACGGDTGKFLGHAGWRHYRGEGTVESPVELLDAGHDVVIGWRGL